MLSQLWLVLVVVPFFDDDCDVGGFGGAGVVDDVVAADGRCIAGDCVVGVASDCGGVVCGCVVVAAWLCCGCGAVTFWWLIGRYVVALGLLWGRFAIDMVLKCV